MYEAKIFVYFKKRYKDLAICALLHDNALTQYIFKKLKNQYKEDEIKNSLIEILIFIVFVVKKISKNSV